MTGLEYEPAGSASPDPLVEGLREQIAALDVEIVELVNRRLGLVSTLWAHKREHEQPLRSPEREEWLLQHLLALEQRPAQRGGGQAAAGVAARADPKRARMTGRVVALPGDGVGPEVIDEAERLLALVAPELTRRAPSVRRVGASTNAVIRCRRRRSPPRAAPTRFCWARSAGRRGTAARDGPRRA